MRTEGDWTSYLLYFLAGVEQVARWAAEQARELVAVREHFRALLSGNAKDLALLDELFRQPYVTVSSASEILGVTDPTASKSIRRLEESGLLREVTGRGWGRIYAAMPILGVINRELPRDVRG